MIVISDFDGTLTIDDVTAIIWDQHLPYDWRATLLPPTYAGAWTPLRARKQYHSLGGSVAYGSSRVHVGPPARTSSIIRAISAA